MIQRVTDYCVEAWNMPLSNSWLNAIDLVTTLSMFAFAVYVVRKYRKKLERTNQLDDRMEAAVALIEASAGAAAERQAKADTLLKRLEAAVNEAYKVLELATKTQQHAQNIRNDVVQEVKDVKKTVERATEVVLSTVSPAPPASGVWKSGDLERRSPDAPPPPEEKVK